MSTNLSDRDRSLRDAPDATTRLHVILERYFRAVHLPTPSEEEQQMYPRMGAQAADFSWVPYLEEYFVPTHFDRTKPRSLRCKEVDRIGKGAFASVYSVIRTPRDGQSPRDKTIGSPDEVFVAKVIKKSRVADSPQELRHLCAELTVTGRIKHPNLNQRVGLFFSDKDIILVLKKAATARPSVQTRVLRYLVQRFPPLLGCAGASGLVEHVLTGFREAATQAGVDPEDEKAFGDLVDERGFTAIMTPLLRAACTEAAAAADGAPPLSPTTLTKALPAELPLLMTVDAFAAARGRLPDSVTRVVLAKTLHGLAALHSYQFLHRDVKNQNVVLGLRLESEIERDAATNAITDIHIFTRYDVQVIDFGTVKILRPALTAASPLVTPASLTTYVQALDRFDQNEQTQQPQQQQQQQPQSASFEQSNQQAASQRDASGSASSDVASRSGASMDARAESLSGLVFSTSLCGTEDDLPADVLGDMLTAQRQSGASDAAPSPSYQASGERLFKNDIFGAGVITYTLAFGVEPFIWRPTVQPGVPAFLQRPQTAPETLEERLRQARQRIQAGASFDDPAVSDEAKRFTRTLLQSDWHARPSAVQVLEDPFIASVGNKSTVHTHIALNQQQEAMPNASFEIVDDFFGDPNESAFGPVCSEQTAATAGGGAAGYGTPPRRMPGRRGSALSLASGGSTSPTSSHAALRAVFDVASADELVGEEEQQAAGGAAAAASQRADDDGDGNSQATPMGGGDASAIMEALRADEHEE